MEIFLKSSSEISTMRKANIVVAKVLNKVCKEARPGMSTMDLEIIAEKMTKELNARPAFKGYAVSNDHHFPTCLCTSINEEVVHGIPSKNRILKDGDILSIDFGAEVDGFYGDAAVTIPIGRVSDIAKKLIQVTRESLYLAITNALRPGKRISDIGEIIQSYVESNGFSVVRAFTGHGIGRALHENPQVPNYKVNGHSDRIQNGMVLAIEPMVNIGSWEVEACNDGWTQVTKDRTLSAHFEHSVALLDDVSIILSQVGEANV